jgi:hypothetical protein
VRKRTQVVRLPLLLLSLNLELFFMILISGLYYIAFIMDISWESTKLLISSTSLRNSSFAAWQQHLINRLRLGFLHPYSFYKMRFLINVLLYFQSHSSPKTTFNGVFFPVWRCPLAILVHTMVVNLNFKFEIRQFKLFT